MKARAIVGLLGTLLAVAPAGFVGGCGSDAADRDESVGEYGTLRAALVTTNAAGDTYRLREASIEIAQRTGTLAAQISSEDHLDDREVMTELLPGPYSLQLRGEYYLERYQARAGSWERVEAALAMDLPASFTVEAQRTTNVALAFLVGDDAITFGFGRASVSLDVSEPSCSTDCDANATCVGTECVCNDGFSGPGEVCEDIDECENGTHDCDANATCTNTPGSYTCECNDYYRGTGTACVLIDEDTYVRDLGDTPVVVEMYGVGDFEVQGLSRIGWDIEVITTPVSVDRVDHEPGTVSVPDVTLRGITGVGGFEATDMATWTQLSLAGDDEPRTITILLEGLGGESLRANYYDVVAVSADTTVTGTGADASMAEVVLRGRTIEVFDYQSGSDPWMPLPGEVIDIGGVYISQVPHGDILRDSPGLSPIRHRELRPGGGAPASGGALLWMDNWTRGIEDRRSASIYQVDLAGNEISGSRYNYYECWPYRLNVFNPAREYAHSYLMDLHMVTEFSELSR